MTIRGIPEAVLLAPDKFKGTFSAGEVAAALARGVRRGGREAWTMPVADGGEGTLAALAPAFELEPMVVEVSDPLGRPHSAEFGLGSGGGRRGSGGGRRGAVAVVEMARASGLSLVADGDRVAVDASTTGTGELIAAAVEAGAQTVYVTVGGSATTDGGTGAVEAILDSGGLRDARLVVLCDVRTVFEEAARVFGPQKGASDEEVATLSDRLGRQAREYADRYGRDPRGVAFTGAAGGLAGGLWAAFGAELVAGAPFVLDTLGFDERMRAARLVVAGEGRLDRQSLAGKALSEVATRSRQAGVPCCAVVGRNELDPFDRRILDLQRVIEASTIAELERAGEELAAAV